MVFWEITVHFIRTANISLSVLLETQKIIQKGEIE
jgi:hypothetical protein